MKKKKIPEVLIDNEKGVYRSRDGVLILEIEKNSDYSLAFGELVVGEKNKKHKIEMQELYYIIQGQGKMIIEDKEQEIEKGDIITIPAKATQQMINSGSVSLKFLMIVNPPYAPEKEEILE